MNGCVLIDSSVWIHAARPGGESTLREEVATLLQNGQAAICAPVWMELYRGIRGKREDEELQRLRDLCQWLDFDGHCWNLAAENGRTLMRAGVNVPTGDLLVHACARRHHAKLLHRDRHFDLMDAAL